MIDWEGDAWSRVSASTPSAHVGEREVVATLLGPRGEVLSQMLDRPHVALGFNRDQPSRWVRP